MCLRVMLLRRVIRRMRLSHSTVQSIGEGSFVALRLSGNQSFNWREKLTIQLSAEEVLSLVAQFLESCSHIVFVHGANGALKRLTLERQSHGYFARLSFNRTFCQLPISHSQQAGLVAFLVDEWRGAYPRLSDHQDDMILKLLRNHVRKEHNCAQ